MGLVGRLDRGKSRLHKQNLSQSSHLVHPTVLENLFSCVHSINQYLTSFVTIAPAEYRRLPYVEWYRLISATFMLYKLSLGLHNVPGWEVNRVREIVDLGGYLNTIASRFSSVQDVFHARNSSCTDLYSMFPGILDSVKEAYMLAKTCPDFTRDDIYAHSDFKDKHGEQLNLVSRCPALRFMRGNFDTANSYATQRANLSSRAEIDDNHEYFRAQDWADVDLTQQLFGEGTITGLDF